MTQIIATYREPFGFEPRVQRMAPGVTLAAMRAQMHGLPDDFDAMGVICINGHVVPRAAWGMVKPKPVANGVPVEVTFHAAPRGGGDNGGKNVLALVASIALVAVTGFIGAGKFATAGGLFRAGSMSASLLAAGVSLTGSLLLSALVPPPTTIGGSDSVNNLGTASAEGNVLEPNGSVPRVVGTMKIYPPLACEPLTYFDGPDEVVEAAYVLAGPHKIGDIRIGAAAIGSLRDVEFETREGWPGDSRIGLLSRQSRTESVQTELRAHLVADDGVTLDTSLGEQTLALPQIQTFATRDEPDEHQLQVIFAQGLHKNGSDTDLLRVPVRLRIRQIGGDWINLPELHFRGANLRQLRSTIRLIWTDDATTAPGAAASEGWCEARTLSPGQTAAPATDDWVADSYFYDGSSDQYLSAANIGSTGVQHVILNRYKAEIYLDASQFPRGRYEIEVQRGAAVRDANWSSSAYTYSGTVWDLFGYQGADQIVMSRNGVVDSLYLLRSVSIWNAHPVPSDALAIVAVRARNRALDAVSCMASGWVRDWDGSSWAEWTVTDNPAPHLRAIWTAEQNRDPVPVDLIDDAELVAWRAACIAAGYTCNAIMEGQTVEDAAQIVASCGYAKPRMTDTWGVARDYDRSAEAPVQIFTPRNSSGFQWTKAFPRLPEGFRVSFRDADRDYDTRQITVMRPGYSDDSGLIEQVAYDGPVHEADVVTKARYDLAQPDVRGVFYNLDMPAEAIVCRRGDLVGVQHDMLTDQAGAGRVVWVEYDGSDVSALSLDSPVPVWAEGDMHAVTNMHAITDMHLVGRKTGVAIRRETGSITVHPVANASGETDRIEFSPPISDSGIDDGVLVTVGALGREFLRLIVFGVTPRADFQASLTLVDEGQELFA
ncbi:hypothetical protein [Paenirhodobacter sp. CAU 1674]|uniref:hypothetical protein n=1 Tax=Paenirhodobacter sp. CAU 1674 TaxID=3032596 RepID=UPI0023DADF00|nr:hypothetical protein [Paenirhodobacter sp. CAU 1674]MDF2140863.1 hypothetical protein [Paenirhodobacter sp. CAU 1674]